MEVLHKKTKIIGYMLLMNITAGKFPAVINLDMYRLLAIRYNKFIKI